VHADAFLFGFLNFFEGGGHLIARLQADQIHFARAHAQRGKRNVDHLPRRDGGHVFRGRLGILHAARMLTHHFASRRASHVHGHVAAADHDHFLADSEFVAEVYVEQKVDALVYAIEIDSGNAEIAAAVRAHGDEHGVEIPDGADRKS
jgi:hypothetical protein